MTKDKEDALYDKFLTAIGADPYPDPQEQFRLAIRAAVAAERERIDDEISDAIQSDLENGVKWLNELAADDFKRKYPAINAVLSKIAAAIWRGE